MSRHLDLHLRPPWLPERVDLRLEVVHRFTCWRVSCLSSSYALQIQGVSSITAAGPARSSKRSDLQKEPERESFWSWNWKKTERENPASSWIPCSTLECIYKRTQSICAQSVQPTARIAFSLIGSCGNPRGTEAPDGSARYPTGYAVKCMSDGAQEGKCTDGCDLTKCWYATALHHAFELLTKLTCVSSRFETRYVSPVPQVKGKWKNWSSYRRNFSIYSCLWNCGVEEKVNACYTWSRDGSNDLSS